MRNVFLLAVAIVLPIACASSARNSRCAPIDPELYMDFGGLYDECTVETRARITSQPRIDYPYQTRNNVPCLFATIKMVVDTTGHPIPSTVQVTSANDERYVEIVLDALPQLRFTPGRVKGRPVNQIARWEPRTAVRQPISGARTPSERNASC